MKLNRFNIIFAAVTLGSLGFSAIAHAQYIWLDEKGTKQYSDMAPPASVPLKRILKEPGSLSRTLSAAPAKSVKEGALAVDKEKDTAPMTIAEKNADFQKRRAEQAEKEKKAGKEAQMASDKTKHCEQARAYQRALQSGERLASVDKNGQRYFISDEQRAKESQEAKHIVDACK